MLGSIQQNRKIYLNIKEGAVVMRTESGEEKYSFVEGELVDIFTRERTFRGETVLYWYIDLRGENNDLYSLGFPYSSNLFKSIVLSLASATDYRRIKIRPYTANGFDKVVCYEGEKKLDWVSKELPQIKDLIVGGRKVKDDTERMKFITSLVGDIRKKVIQ